VTTDIQHAWRRSHNLFTLLACSCCLLAGGAYLVCRLLDRQSGVRPSDNTNTEERVVEVRDSGNLDGSLADQMMFLPLAAGSPASSRQEIPTSTKEATTFVWQQKRFAGEIKQSVVERVIAGGRAELLEPHVADAHLPSLHNAMSDVEAAMKEGAQVYNNEVKRVKSLLRTNPDRTVIIRSRDRTLDPRYGELQSWRAQVDGRLGAVWGDWDPVAQEEVHYVIKWKEWTQLKQILDDQVMLVDARAQAVREWITTTYEREGMALFRTQRQ
jgi:hypothetical protein